ncbi:MAG: hypothetical protein Ct9H300mP23_01350 [Nitrospinota bacterium]|nr:MAG: hypothetical protein Ct9H300mP23_01350 [Nitrospinota bacterium]
MNIDPELLEKVQKENEEFRGLYRKHITLKQKVEEFNKMKIITPLNKRLKRKSPKKQKLSLKDRMEKILSEYESSIL